jgi:tRNA-specific 2-thiouridylase
VPYAVLLSGGVDSATALSRLAQETRDVTAYYLKVWLEDELESLGDCPWEEDLDFARRVCAGLGVPLTVISLQIEYYDRVVQYTIDELRAGRTPSPDIFCNERIKFGAFLDRLTGNQDGGEPLIATGHYAGLADEGDHVLLHRSPDPVKDQTYFLAHLSQEQLRRIRFPLAGLTKRQVRELARRYDLPNKDRPDSQGICFLGKVRYPEFIRHYLGERPGLILDADSGRELGRHRGYWFHTIGQRQGLGLSGGPWYVVAKDTERNEIHVSHSSAAMHRARATFQVDRLSWTWKPPRNGRYHVKIRHGPALTGCSIEWAGNDELAVRMDTEDRGVAAGQYAVFYDREVCLGCGRIREV